MLQIDNKTGRLLSLDALRGLDMLFSFLSPSVILPLAGLSYGFYIAKKSL